VNGLDALEFIKGIRAALPDGEDISIHLVGDDEVEVVWSQGGQLYTLPHEMGDVTDPRALVVLLAAAGNMRVEA